MPKSIHALKGEHDDQRELYGKAFYERETGEAVQLLFCAFSHGNEVKMAVYVQSSMPWLKHTMEFESFLALFTTDKPGAE